jgi:hypothetical protein
MQTTFNFLTALKSGQKRHQIPLTLAGDDIEDLVVTKVAEGRGKALLLMRSVLINPKYHGALKALALSGFTAGILGVDALNSG